MAEAFLLLVLASDFADGLTKLEWRWRIAGKKPRGFRQPLWLGEPLDGKTILLHAEQGFGDSLLLLRYAPLVAARGGRVVIEVPRALVRLMAGLAGAPYTVIAEGTPLPAFDVHCPLMSLPLAFGTKPATIPAAIPYFTAEAALVARWRDRLGAGPEMKVGIGWAGNPIHKNDRSRSLTLDRLAPLLELPGVRWFSLQVGERAADLAAAPVAGQVTDLAPELDGFCRDRRRHHGARSGDHGRHRGRPSRRRARQAAMDPAAVRSGLALVPRSHRQPVVPERAAWCGKPRRGLGRRHRANPCCAVFLPRCRAPGRPRGGQFRRADHVRSPLLRRRGAHRPSAGRGRSGVPVDPRGESAACADAAASGHAAAICAATRPKPRRCSLARSKRDPDHAEAHYNLGLVLAALGRREEAEASYRRGLALKPGSVDGHNNLGVLLEEVGRYEEAAACYRRAIELAPELAHPLNNLGVLLKESGQLAAALQTHRRAIALDPDLPAVHSNMLYTLNYDETVSPQALFAVHRAWGQDSGVGFATEGARFTNPPEPERRLRVGYVSGDFRHHSVAFFVEPLLEAHDARYGRGVPLCQWHPRGRGDGAAAAAAPITSCRSAGLSDELAAAAHPRSDGIDILVDLAGHTSGNRLLLFARKPAPVQVSWLGYPNTTGLPAIDYRLTDAVADPPGEADALAHRAAGAARARLPVLSAAGAGRTRWRRCRRARAGHVTFGSFNNFAKLSPGTHRAVGARCCARCRSARLLLKATQFKDAGTRARCIAAFAAAGIARASASRSCRRSPTTPEHLALYGRVDIALDPLPYNGTDHHLRGAVDGRAGGDAAGRPPRRAGRRQPADRGRAPNA